MKGKYSFTIEDRLMDWFRLHVREESTTMSAVLNQYILGLKRGNSALKKGNYNLDIDGKGRKQYTGEQVRDIVAEKLETTYDNLQELNTGKLERISAKEYDKLPKKEKIKWERDIIDNEYTKHPLEDYTIGFYDAKKTQRILNIEKFMEDLSKAFYEGPDKALEFAINVGSDGNMQLLKSLTKELIIFKFLGVLLKFRILFTLV